MRALTGGAVSGLKRAMQIRAGPVGDGSNKAAWTGPWASRGAQGQPVADGQVGACAAAAGQGVFGVGEGVGRTGGLELVHPAVRVERVRSGLLTLPQEPDCRERHTRARRRAGLPQRLGLTTTDRHPPQTVIIGHHLEQDAVNDRREP
jgi:hypothetical protein